jgi:hypothetical protein
MVGASDSGVVDLSAQKDDLPVDLTSVDTLFVYDLPVDLTSVDTLFVYDVIPMGTQHRGARWGRTRYAKGFLLKVSVELIHSEASRRSQIGSCLRLRRVKERRACSSGVAVPRMWCTSS